MISLIYTLLVFAVLAYFLVMPKRRFLRPPYPDNDDEGGEPLDDGLPDLDLPPGITRPINDWEPDYNRGVPTRPAAPLV
ncbi:MULTISPECIES: hypothetical protein [Hymenobacter]|uniref:Cbb3-type cytochrome c oxidase subunit 3 n=3 Tax=Hymenobacter TaxID=89966 RepID=A0ABR7MPT7_9BACT|nr:MULTISPECIES: hypothetical protein [Hymenobacter]MBC6613089.1 hypothetical protein [Hymenobacter citatus]MBO3272705.1 hypothetical protein [Hymenobacter defluvii]MBW3130991.1 hypothetical protein [Hymenobacter profundi]QNE40593.1 hypothetical protein F1C16_13985 [Hymenobacter sp. NBH84]